MSDGTQCKAIVRARSVIAELVAACALSSALGCQAVSSDEGSHAAALSDPTSASAPELLAIELEDPAVVSADADISVLAAAPDGAIDGLRVAVQAGAGPSVELGLAEVSDAGALFIGSYATPDEEGDYLVTVVATSADGEQIEATQVALAAAAGGWCDATCYKRDKVVAQRLGKLVTTGEFCEIFCSRFCFGPRGNGADEVQCVYTPR